MTLNDLLYDLLRLFGKADFEKEFERATPKEKQQMLMRFKHDLDKSKPKPEDYKDDKLFQNAKEDYEKMEQKYENLADKYKGND